jgi:hypothetical protein
MLRVEAELREQLAAMTKERDEALSYINEIPARQSDLIKSKAREAKLREALAAIRECADASFALPIDSTALDERLKQERERCAKVCVKQNLEGCAEAIRSLT